MNKKALFCDGTSQYVNPNRSATKKLRSGSVLLRTMQKHVCLVHEKIRYEMEKTETGEVFDYYEIKRQLGEEPVPVLF